MDQFKITLLPPVKRLKNFKEVEVGFSKKQAMEEAHRCPQCAHPECVSGCPLGIDIPGFIRSIREGDFQCALQKIREKNSLAGICGRLCSAPCEKACFLNHDPHGQSISIRALERFVSDYGQSRVRQIFNAQSSHLTEKKIAIIGSGLSGLFVASQLREDGHQVTIFEAQDRLGGSLRDGVPEFRLPGKVLDTEIEYIQSLGIDIKTHHLVGECFSFDDIFSQGYQAIVLATGFGMVEVPMLSGWDHVGVYSSWEILSRLSLEVSGFRSANDCSLLFGDTLAVVGSDQATLDCARIGARLGKKSVMISSLTQEEIQAPLSQQQQALEEGVTIETLVKPLSLVSDEHQQVSGVHCLRLDFAATEQDSKWKLMPVKNSEFIIEAKTVILSGARCPNTRLVRIIPQLKIDKRQCFYRKQNGETSIPKVFAVGSCALGQVSLIDKMADGQHMTKKISSSI